MMYFLQFLDLLLAYMNLCNAKMHCEFKRGDLNKKRKEKKKIGLQEQFIVHSFNGLVGIRCHWSTILNHNINSQFCTVYINIVFLDLNYLRPH